MHKTKRQMHSNIRIFKFRVYLISYARLFMKLNLFEILLLPYIYYNESFQIYGYIAHLKTLVVKKCWQIL